MKLLKLSSLSGKEPPIYINPDYIVSIEYIEPFTGPDGTEYKTGSRVAVVGGDNRKIRVFETPDEIMKLLYWEDVGHVR